MSTDTITVRVADRSTWGSSLPYPRIVTVTIAATCPRCGGPRGVDTIRGHRFHEDGEWYVVDRWSNPCGHVDMYDAVLREAREGATA